MIRRAWAYLKTLRLSDEDQLWLMMFGAIAVTGVIIFGLVWLFSVTD